MLNDLLRDKLQIVANDELLITAIRVVFDERIEQMKPLEWDDDNTKLGEKYRAYLQAKKMIEQSFIDLMSYKVDKKPEKTFSKER